MHNKSNNKTLLEKMRYGGTPIASKFRVAYVVLIVGHFILFFSLCHKCPEKVVETAFMRHFAVQI